MTASRIAVPPRLVAATERREGDAGRDWLARLPALADAALAGFDVVADGDAVCGEIALVVPVRRTGDGTPLAVKLSYPHPGNLGEGDALTAFAGVGAVRLHARSADGLALLLERAGPASLADHDRGADAADDVIVEAMAELSARLAVPAPADMPALADSAPERLAELDGLERRAHDAGRLRAEDASRLERARLVLAELADAPRDRMLHGDLHAGNVLASRREPWLAIDPKGLAGLAEWDAGTAALGRAEATLAAPGAADLVARRIARFCDVAGLDRGLATRLAAARAAVSLAWQLAHDGEETAVAVLRRLAPPR